MPDPRTPPPRPTRTSNQPTSYDRLVPLTLGILGVTMVVLILVAFGVLLGLVRF